MRLLNNFSIKSKLIVMLLAVSSCSILLTAYIGYRSGQTNLTNRVFNQLTSVRASKAYQIEAYFKNIQNHTQTLSEDPSVIAAMQEFDAAYRQLQSANVPDLFDEKIATYYRNDFLPRLAKVDEGSPILQSYTPKATASRYLQYHYIAANANPVGKKHFLNAAKDGSEYSDTHARYHPIFRKLIEKFGYYDMFLIDPEGTIVYTVFKETDFVSNFETGPYKDSNLAELSAIVRESKERDFSKIVDFAAYSPSYGAPAAFIAAPIFNQSKLIGILAFQMPVDEINNVMTGNRNWESDGLGKTGESYLVGRDFLMRSISRFLVQDPKGYAQALRSIGFKEPDINRIQQYNTSILQQNVQTEAVEESLAGSQGTQIIDNYRGIPVLSSYAPLKIDGLDWVILSEMDLAEAYAPIYSLQNQILVYATLLMLLVTLIAMAMAYLFVKPINKLIESARKVAAGELTAIAPLETEDEFGELARSFNAMVRSLRTQTNLVEQKNQENEQLLLSVFPAAIAKRLKRGEKDIAEDVSNVSVLSAELTGFSKLSASLTAYEIVAILNDLVTAFDEVTERYGMEKIKTIGDSYLAVCGLSVPYLDHDRRAIDFAMEMLAIMRRFTHERDFKLNIRIGINSGDVVAGIVGRNKFIYDVWGDTINLANALRSVCPPGSILVAQAVHHRLHDLYEFEAMGELVANGKTKVDAWRLKNTQLSVQPEGVKIS
ncbi:MAG: adenylate/guanylate cyclase domain-containing protein [Drouetiella hepatica Uher 2000/2452]|jgi:class 3 adenylate cyclase/large-conductance mechanosensitive channel|uniref:Adenylate/guanylate cyclase domain-containing protein n=1 Tax=Drouetiella hepatica Uher 2000/2452 TaxID=904376 RepID=A0A951UQ65_9CYAN|nr:adenylate/guanylate cyclase domain-containing protein [Drouetiella hepatica Uher 2000/2452]